MRQDSRCASRCFDSERFRLENSEATKPRRSETARTFQLNVNHIVAVRACNFGLLF
jgi:hypothetical protein